MLCITNIVTDVMENVKNTIVILDDNVMIVLLVSCITSWLPELATILFIAITEAICINAIIDIDK